MYDIYVEVILHIHHTWVCWDSWIYKVIFYTKFEMFLFIISLGKIIVYLFYSSCSLSVKSYCTYMLNWVSSILNCLIVSSYTGLWDSQFFFSSFNSVFFGLNSFIGLSSSSPILASSISNHLLMVNFYFSYFFFGQLFLSYSLFLNVCSFNSHT